MEQWQRVSARIYQCLTKDHLGHADTATDRALHLTGTAVKLLPRSKINLKSSLKLD